MILSNLAQKFTLNREKTFVPAFLRSVLITDLFDNLLFWKKVCKKSSILDPKIRQTLHLKNSIVWPFVSFMMTVLLDRIKWNGNLPFLPKLRIKPWEGKNGQSSHPCFVWGRSKFSFYFGQDCSL